jgi:hypothetical protein
MTTATLDNVSGFTERDSFFLHFAEAAKSAAKNTATWLFLPFCLVGAVILAQFYPSHALKFVERLNARLPDITDKDELELIRDVLKLAYGTGRFYGHFSLVRRSSKEAQWEISETIDSIEFVLNNKNELKEFVATSEAQRIPELPFPHTHRAAG